MPEKASRAGRVPVPKPIQVDTENTKVIELTLVKELGKIAP